MKNQIKVITYDNEFLVNSYANEIQVTTPNKSDFRKARIHKKQIIMKNAFVIFLLAIMLIGILISFKAAVISACTAVLLTSLSFIISILRMDFKFVRDIETEEVMR